MKKIFLTVFFAMITVLSVFGLSSCDEECTHEWSEWSVSSPSTCSAQGTKQRKCSKCDEVQTESIDIADHEYDTENLVWTWNGYESATATLSCITDNTHTRQINANVTDEVTTALTCTATGTKTYTATVKIDGITYTATKNETLAALGHTEVTDAAIAATCEKTGLTEGSHCSVCKEVLVTQQETPKAAHTETKIEAVAATCSAEGATEGVKCSVCGEILVAPQPTSKVAHTEETVPAVAATCEKAGLTEGKKCSVCGEVLLAQTETALADHTEEIVPAVAATCSESGLTEGKKCSVCNTTLVEQETIEKLSHTEEILSAKSPTCTETGLTEGKKCSVCGETIIEQTVLDTISCNYEAETTLPTCEDDGFTTHTCIMCGDDYVDSYVDSFGHSWGKWENQSGTTLRFCTNECDCGKYQRITSISATYNGIRLLTGESVLENDVSVIATLDDGTKITITDFDLEDAIMTKDGNNIVTVAFMTLDTTVAVPAIYNNLPGTTATSEFEYTVKNDAVTITKFVGTSTDIVIPAHIDRVPVRYIGHQAFNSCILLESATIPNSVTKIENRAFYGCKSLKVIVIPAKVKTIGEYAFAQCTKLQSAIIGDDVEQINPTTIEQSAFQRCTSLKQVSIGNGVSIIYREAFSGCTALESVTLGKLVSSLGYQAFNGCVSLKSINLSDGIVKIDGRAFYGCENLTNIAFGDKLTTIEDYAFSGCKSLDSVIIPANVKTIGEYAFAQCTKLQNVIIGDDIEQITPTTIEGYVFAGCTSLTSVFIGNGVNSIPRNAFYGCTALKSIALGDNINSIGYQAFEGCIILETVIIPNSVTKIDNRAFYGCKSLKNVTIPSSVKTVGEYAFYECTKLESVIIGDNAEQITPTTIGQSAFQRCTALKQVYVGNGVSTISREAFFGCTTLESVTLSGSVTTLGYQSFSGCVSLKSINLSGGIVKIDGRAFYGCELLTDLTFGEKLTTIGDYSFNGCKSLVAIVIPSNVKTIGEYAFAQCTKLQSAIIGDDVEQINPTTIEGYVFSGCSSLTRVSIGNGVSSIPRNAFYGCTVLDSITLGNNINSIGYQAFEGCTLLNDVTIPNSVTKIDSRAFYGCKSLTNIIIPANVKEIGANAFNSCIKLQSAIIGNAVEQINPITIGQEAFRGCTSLKQVIIGNGVKIIEREVFFGCTALESITMGKSITSLGIQLFYNCTSLATINYAGSEDAWNSISKGNYWDKNTGAYTIKYNCNIEITETYTVTFRDYDGTVLKTQSSITKGAAATAPAAPTRDGYTFAGWDKSFDNITADLVVTATYTLVVPDNCAHTDKIGIGYEFDKNLTYIDQSKHTVKVMYQYRCNTCGEEFVDTDHPEIKEEAHIHDFEVNGGWVCRCGHIQDVVFEAYEANLQSNVNQTTYYDSGLTVQYGIVYVTDTITVIGSTEVSYLIKYPLDAGGYKLAFIAKKHIDVNGDMDDEVPPDYRIDINNDNIPDYYNELIRQGKLLLRDGSDQFAGKDFTLDINGNFSDDYDGDGIINGEELIIVDKDGELYLDMKSDPTKKDTDMDGMSDKYDDDPLNFSFLSEKINGIDYQGTEFVITESCVWYNANYYDYIVNWEEPWWNLGDSQIDSKAVSDGTRAISHIMLLTPEDAELFAMIYYGQTSEKAWEEVHKYIFSLYKDAQIGALNLDQVMDEATEMFFESMLKSYNIEKQSIDKKSLVFGYTKSLILKAMELDKFSGVISNIVDFEVFVANLSSRLIHDSKWNEVILENAKQGYGTTFLFFFDPYDKSFSCSVMEFNRGGYAWIPESETYVFKSPYKHTVKYGDERYVGYLSYEIEDLEKCQQDLYDGKYTIKPIPGQYQ